MSIDPIAELAERWTRLGQAAVRFHDQTQSDEAEARQAAQAEARRHAEATASIRARLHDILARATSDHHAAESTARSSHAERMQSLEAKAKVTVEEILRCAETHEAKVKEAYQHALWMAETVYEASENASRLEHEERRRRSRPTCSNSAPSSRTRLDSPVGIGSDRRPSRRRSPPEPTRPP